MGLPEAIDHILHIERHRGDRQRVVGARDGDPAGDHIGVADRLYFLQFMGPREGGGLRKELVQQPHDGLRRPLDAVSAARGALTSVSTLANR